MIAISSAVGRGSSLGGMIGLAAASQDANDAAALGVAGQERGPVRSPALERRVALERKLPLAILVVMAAGAVFLEDRERRAWRNRACFRPSASSAVPP